MTRSELEERFLALVRDAGLPEPLLNATVHGFEVDAYWPERRLVVELDGFAVHGTRAAFEADRRRDRELRLQGIDVVRFTWRDIALDAGSTRATVRALLA